MSFNISIGVDIEQIKRFENKTLENSARFLNYIFTQNELEYCFSKSKPAMHLCARFCAKEAVYKALSEFNIGRISLKEIEILNKDSGVPYINLEKYPELNIKISISHTKEYATASAICYK